jgi:hypothetical protein
MMRGLAIVLLVALASGLASGPDGDDGFARVLPRAVGDTSGWTTVTGEFETARARGAYLFSVNPRRQALYQLMRYRIELLAPANEQERVRPPAERVVYAPHPGQPEPLRCWVHQPPGTRPAWREVHPGTPEYLLEMALLMRVLEIHRVARTGQAP